MNKPRHAETTDTRQGIRRHDPEYERRKKKKQDKEDPVGFDEEDNAIVSVEALRVFLQNFLKSTDAPVRKVDPEKDNKSTDSAAGDVQRTNASSRRPSGRAAKAANAYQHSAEAVRGNFSATDQESSVTVAQSLGLGSDEVRTIHVLLEDLKAISERKIEYLRIERSDSFLQSLVDAVAKIKT